jgi:cardiolipin synthase A/B
MRARTLPASLAATLVFMVLAGGGCAGLAPGYPYKIESLYGVDDPQFTRTMGHLLGPPLVEGNSAQTFVNGDQIFPAMLAEIAKAEKSITFETFIYWKGKLGDKFTDALAERARAGVKVHLLIDAVGADKVDESYIKRMTDAGCQVEVYNPLQWFDITSAARLNNRTHRKLLVVDGKVGFTGGVGIADIWLGNAQDAEHWRDNQYRITGPVVADLQSAFADHWIESNGGVIHGEAYFPKLERTGEKWGQVFKSGPGGGGESMQLMYLLSFAAARKHIRLATAYFVPDQLTVDTLVEARKRGVHVQLIIPGGEQNDVPLAHHASRSSWGELLRAGVEIYQYQPTMYHCKVMVVDGLWTSVGSTNLHNRGFRLNGEANLNILDPDFAAEQEKVLDEDLKHCRAVTLQEWENRSFGERFQEWMAETIRWQL